MYYHRVGTKKILISNINLHNISKEKTISVLNIDFLDLYKIIFYEIKLISCKLISICQINDLVIRIMKFYVINEAMNFWVVWDLNQGSLDPDPGLLTTELCSTHDSKPASGSNRPWFKSQNNSKFF